MVSQFLYSDDFFLKNDSVNLPEFEELACLAGVPNLAFSPVIEPLAQVDRVFLVFFVLLLIFPQKTDCASFLSQLGSQSGSAPMLRGRGYGGQMMSNMLSNNIMSQQMYGGGGGKKQRKRVNEGNQREIRR